MKKILLLLVPLLVALGGCELTEVEDGTNVSELQISVSGLRQLPDTLIYATWLTRFDLNKQENVSALIDPVTVGSDGSFTLSTSKVSFEQIQASIGVGVTIEKKSRFVFTSEAEEDSLRKIMKPAGRSILQGKFGSNTLDLTVNNVITDFSEVSGMFTLLTPTDGNTDQNETSGIWFADSVDRVNGPLQGINLQDAKTGWSYFAWVETGSAMLKMGGFTSASAADDSSYFSSTVASGLPFPGEDFLLNAPAGVTFPLNLAGAKVIITAQPDYLSEPTDYIRILEADIPSNAAGRSTVQMDVVYESSAPKGSANIVITH